MLFRAVDIGAELFAIAASCVRAQMLAKQGNREAAELADLFCRAAGVRVKQLFASFYGDYDAQMYKVAQQVMRGEHSWLETGIISLVEDEGAPPPAQQPRAGETVGAA